MPTPHSFRSRLLADYRGEPVQGLVDKGTRGPAEISIVQIGQRFACLSRGSNELSDWLWNLSIWKRHGRLAGYSGTEYPAGFLDRAESVWDWLDDNYWLRKISFISGHSAGASDAQIIGWSLGIQAVCFSSPPVVYGQRIEPQSEIVHYCHEYDPLNWLDGRYCHRIARAIEYRNGFGHRLRSLMI